MNTPVNDIDLLLQAANPRLLTTDLENSIAQAAATAVWQNISGTGKPEDGATVGAPSGTLVAGVAASTVATAITNFNSSNDRNGAAVTSVTVLTDGTAVDHTIRADGAADISFEWVWAGNEGDIDGFLVYVYQSASSSAYSFGTTPAAETVYTVPANKRAFIFFGAAATLYTTFGVQAYRAVDKDVNSTGAVKSLLVKPTLAAENPYRPSANIAFAGDVTGTINGIAAANVNVWDYVVGQNKPADNATADITLIGRGVAVTGNNLSKTTVSNSYDSDAFSSYGYVGGAFVMATAVDTAHTVMFGLDSNPTEGSTYTTIDYSIYLRADGIVWTYESGSSSANGGVTYVAGDVFLIAYDGTSVRYYKNSVLFRTTTPASPIAGALFFDSSFGTAGGKLNGVRFGPLSSNNWASIGGTGKPADNATVGAPSGTLVAGVSADSIATATTNFNSSNDRNGAAVAAPTILTDGTAVDHTIRSDGAADISLEWAWSGNEGDIDGFLVYAYQSSSSAAYSFGTTPAAETVYTLPANKRAFIMFGAAADLYTSFGVQAYRSVDKDINPTGAVKSLLVKPTLAAENPYRPSANIAFAGNVTGTINNIPASQVNVWNNLSGKPADSSILNSNVTVAPNLVENVKSWTLGGGAYTYEGEVNATDGRALVVPAGAVCSSRTLNLLTNTDYTLSFRAIASANTNFSFDLYPDTLPEKAFPITTAWQTFSVKWNSSVANMASCVLRALGSTTTQVIVTDIKLEKGATKTPWIDSVITTNNSKDFLAPGAIPQSSVQPTALAVTIGDTNLTSQANTTTYQSYGVTPSVSNGPATSYVWSFSTEQGDMRMTSDPTASSATVQARGTNVYCSGWLTLTIKDQYGGTASDSAHITVQFGSGVPM